MTRNLVIKIEKQMINTPAVEEDSPDSRGVNLKMSEKLLKLTVRDAPRE